LANLNVIRQFPLTEMAHSPALITFESMETETVGVNVCEFLRGLKHIQATTDPDRQFS
jgi:hypothetical protein